MLTRKPRNLRRLPVASTRVSMPIAHERVILCTVEQFVAHGYSGAHADKLVRRGRRIDMGPAGACWTSVPDAPEYEVTRCGIVRCVFAAHGHRLGVRRPGTRGGYVTVNVTIAGRVVNCLHWILAVTFLGPRPTPRHVVHYIDSNPTNNRVENLAWMTIAEIRREAAAAGKRHSFLSEAQAREVLSSPENGAALARRFGVTRQQINHIRLRKSWKHLTDTETVTHDPE